ncbi:N-ethylmaleimide reductase [Hyella patelloides LEGE 07179]|uniref:N-ethylmaleimide reductase n=1 Tax=Hyella patelloides LEGE 07179 TaxID=945734 RepID=A0A563VJW9_9CYAN|nr:alkene reductase [Hyella patelloides]VEP11627.1 N-ethylmaleimide reductase [Hyella patelloides LEGE 07179]
MNQKPVNLFNTFQLGNLHLPHRVIMAPMTRSRTAQPGDIPTDLMAKYYAQRASAGLIITEATQISQQGKGYSFTPGIHTPKHIDGWRKVTKAVHQAGGRIFLQLWHVGRMSHESFHANGQPVAPSAIQPDARVWIADGNSAGQMLDCPTPRELAINEIKAIINDFRQGAANAIAAGFDGVEIHGANGYLIDQFLRRTSNKRTDIYGGDIPNRVRFLEEVVETVVAEVGKERTGIRLAPYITQRGMNDPEAIDAILYAARKLDRMGIAYIHLVEADWDDAPVIPESFRRDLRDSFSGAIIVAGNYTAAKGEAIIDADLADLVAYGRWFLANPDLPYRLQHDLELNEMKERATLFGGDAEGYTDYPDCQEKAS